MAPANLTGLIIDGFDHAFSPNSVIRTRPAVSAVSGLRKINTIAGMCVDDKQSILCIEARRPVVCHSAFVGRNEPPIGGWLFGWVRNRAALRIHAQRPIHRTEGSSQKALPSGTLEHEEIS